MDNFKIAYLCFDLNKISEADLESLMSILPTNRLEKLMSKAPQGRAESLFVTLLCYYLLKLNGDNNGSVENPSLINVTFEALIQNKPALSEISRQVGWHVAEDGKPFKNGLDFNGNHLFLSLSHCGVQSEFSEDFKIRNEYGNRTENCHQTVVCAAISNREIGVDVQLISSLESESNRIYKLAERFYWDKERERINRSDDSIQSCLEFYKIWSQKESVIKLNGGGIKLLRSFAVEVDGTFSLNEKTGNVRSWRLKELGIKMEAEGYLSVAFYDEKKI